MKPLSVMKASCPKRLIAWLCFFIMLSACMHHNNNNKNVLKEISILNTLIVAGQNVGW